MTFGKGDIMLVGIGGCGSTVVEDLLLEETCATSCVVLTTDHQTLKTSSAQHVIKVDEQIFSGIHQTKNSNIPATELDELKVQVRQVLRGAVVVVMTAGMGTGTSSPIALLVAQIAVELGSLVIAFVTTPFVFEGESRNQQANDAINQLQSVAHATVVLSNRRLIYLLGHKARMTDAFNASTTVIKDAFSGIKNMVNQNGLINLDLADLHAALDNKGLAVVGRGEARGEDKAETAILKAISTPILENCELRNAQTLIVMLQVGDDFSVGDLEDIGTMLSNLLGQQTDIFVGVTLNQHLFKSVTATVMATGIPRTQEAEQLPPKPLKLSWHVRK